MQKKSFFLLCLLTCVALNAGAWQDVLTVRRLAISSIGGQKQFYVKSTVPWTVTTPNNWISIRTPELAPDGTSMPNGQGKGKAEGWGDRDGGELVTVTIWPSDSISPETGDAVERRERNGFIRVSYGTTVRDIPVYQLNHDSCWHDGEAILVKAHGEIPAGQKPIPVMLFGDGWDLMDNYKSYHESDGRGFFPAYAAAWAKRLCGVDMTTDFADYFDFYAYSGESNQRGTHGLSKYRNDPASSRNMDIAVSSADATIKDHINIANAIFVDLSNDTPGGWNFYAGGRQYAAYGNPDNGPQTGLGWWGHEMNGHNTSNMPDFYNPTRALDWTNTVAYALPDSLNDLPGNEFTKYPDAPYFREGVYPTAYQDGSATNLHAVWRLYSEWDAGYYWAIDYESDPSKVIWKDFIGKTGYNNVGVHSGQTYTGSTGYYRPEPINEMINHGAGWDVGMRIWIWNRILERAGVGNPHNLSAPDPTHLRSIERFKEWDVAHGYNNNLTGWLHNPTVPPLLTKEYYYAHNLQLLAPFTFVPTAEDSCQATPPVYPEGYINMTLVTNGDSGTGWAFTNQISNYNNGKDDNVVLISAPGEYKFVGATNVNNIVVASNVEDVVIELRSVSIDVSSQNKPAIDIKGGASATIKVYGNSLLGGGPNAPGISVPHKGGSGNVPATASLTITSSRGDGSTDGYLKVTSGAFAAGIGGGNIVHTSSGKITINGGTLDVYGAVERPAIGGRSVNGVTIESSVTINGGKVTATAGSGSAGIGGGTQKNNFGTITINGGSVITSGSDNAALGGGQGTVNITGGTVVARNKVNDDANETPVQPGLGGATFNVTGGSIIATGVASTTNISNATLLTSNVTGTLTAGTNALVIKDKENISFKTQSLSTAGGSDESTLSTKLLLKSDATIPAANTLYIPEGENLVIDEGVTLTIDGSIVVYGGLTCNKGNIVGDNKITVADNGYFAKCDGSLIVDIYEAKPIEAIKVHTVEGGVFVNLPVATDIDVYTILGQKVYSLAAVSGSRTIPLNKGLYIIKTGEKGHKIIVK